MEEMWKEIVGYPGYSISNFGNIKSHHTNGGSIDYDYSRILRPIVKKNGYKEVCLVKIINGKRIHKTILVHKLVALTFIGERPSGRFIVICHRDGNKQNNIPENLRYDTHVNNIKDAMESGQVAHGNRIRTCKLSENDVIIIRHLYNEKMISQRKLSIMFGVCKTQIGNIVRNVSWKHVPENR